MGICNEHVMRPACLHRRGKSDYVIFSGSHRDIVMPSTENYGASLSYSSANLARAKDAREEAQPVSKYRVGSHLTPAARAHGGLDISKDGDKVLAEYSKSADAT